MGQFILQISVYYRPLLLVLSKPHIITCLLFFPLFLFRLLLQEIQRLGPNKNNPRIGILDIIRGMVSRNEIAASISAYKVSFYTLFWNSMLFQLFTNYFYPTSTLFRLVHVYLFRSNNKIFFLVSNLFG
jgi:hypothetical protein